MKPANLSNRTTTVASSSFLTYLSTTDSLRFGDPDMYLLAAFG